MGGETGVISAENRGATFWFTAQFARAAGDEETRADAAGDPLPRLRRPGARILLAEDNQTNRIVALKILERLGARPEAVAGGIEAVAAFAATRPDLVLMDCEMADVDGYEATRRIRDMERASDGATDTAKARSPERRGACRSSPSRRTPFRATETDASRRAWTTTFQSHTPPRSSPPC
jgi:CheY-like chemotaxis protein